MKKVIILFITLILVLVQMEAWTIVNATTGTLLSCTLNQYSVERIIGKDQFSKLGCFEENQFLQAYDFMQSEASKLPNVVIRHAESKSALKIVAADRAMAYSQNKTYLGDTTVYVYNEVSLSSRLTYINEHNPIYYFETHIKSKSPNELIKPSDLVVEIEVNGAHGYMVLNAVDIVPLIYVENRVNKWYINLQTKNVETDQLKPNPILPNITQYIVYDVDNYTISGIKRFRQIRVQVDGAMYPATNYELGLAPDWLSNGTYYSPNGIKFYYDMDLKNPVLVDGKIGEYYNYYQYLNLRSKTNYTDEDFKNYFMYFSCVQSKKPNTDCTTASYSDVFNTNPPIFSGVDLRTSALFPYIYDSNANSYSPRPIGQFFINAQDNYGFNALMIYAFALHESGYGTSAYAKNRNNLFGYAAYDAKSDDAYAFTSIESGINEVTGIYLRYYLDYSNYNPEENWSLFYASNIGTKGHGLNNRYASDPWWSVKIANIAFRIDRYNGLKDLNDTQTAILSDTSRLFYKNRELTSVAYEVNSRAKNYPLIIKSKYNSVYYTQSTNPIDNGSIITSTTKGPVKYNWEQSIVYLDSSQVRLVNSPKTSIIDLTPPTQLETDTAMNLITQLNWNGDLLEVKGASALRNTNMALNPTTHTLSVISNLDSSIVFDFPLEIDVPLYNINLNNGFDYSSAWFKGTFDIKDIPEGFYKFVITTKSGITTGKFDMINTPTTPMPTIKSIGNYNYRFVFNNFKRMSYELIKEKGILIEQQSPVLFSRFPSFGLITNFEIIENEQGTKLLSIDGAALMQHVNQGPNDNVTHKLMLVDTLGNQTLFDLNTLSGSSSMITDKNFDYSNSSFTGSSIDITSLASENYRVYVVVKNTNYTDVVELKNYAFIKEINFDTSDRTYSLKINNILRKRFELNIIEKVDTTEVTTP